MPVFTRCRPSKFLRAANGVTVLCPEASVGESGFVGPTKYTRRDRKQLEALIASKSWDEVAASCVSGVNDMSNLFLGQDDFDADIASWDVSAVESMVAMFYDASLFNRDLAAWNVSQVTRCDKFAGKTSSWVEDQPNFIACTPSKFYLAENGITVLCPDAVHLETGTVKGVEFTKRNRDGYYGLRYLAVDSTKWDLLDKTCITGVTDLSTLFVGAAVLGRDDQHLVTLQSWDTSAVTDMNYCFAGASLFNQDISAWNTSKVCIAAMLFRAHSSQPTPHGRPHPTLTHALRSLVHRR